MKVKLLEAMGGADKSHAKGAELEVDDATAIRFVDAGVAVPTNKKVYEAAVKKSIDTENSKLEDEKKAAAILYKDELLAEKQTHLSRVDEINKDLEIEEVVISKVEYEKLLALVPKEGEEQK